jgi:amino acid adenylation domain-containing protein/non-ribosomal peptide synthase protein (TIGR01720 family)
MTNSFPEVPVKKFSNLADILCSRAQAQPDKTAYIFLKDGETEEARLTYKELDEQTRFVAAQLQSLGAAGERALLLYPPGLDYIAAFFGCLYARVMAVPVYPPHPARPERTMPRLRGIVKDARPFVALTASPILKMAESFFSQDSDLGKMHWLATDRSANENQESEISSIASGWLRDPSVNSDTLAFLQYTSGSTGSPKGVMVSHGNLLHNGRLMMSAFGQTEESVCVNWLPLYHDMGLIGNALQGLYVGMPCILMSPAAFLQKPFRWLQAITRYKGTFSGAPNFAYDLCVKKIAPEQRQSLDLSSWKNAFNGSEPVQHDTLERFAAGFESCGFRRETFYPCYGLAEATLMAAGGESDALPVSGCFDKEALEEHQVIPADKNDIPRLMSSGTTREEQQIVIVNPHSRTRCQANEVGEIWISGGSVAKGYWEKPEETEKTFRAYLADTGEGPFLRTGDLGFLQDRELFVTGRLKDLIIIRGRNHYPQDIEVTAEQSSPRLRPGCSAAFSVDINGTEHLVVAAEVERRFDTRRQKQGLPPNKEERERRSGNDRRQIKELPEYPYPRSPLDADDAVGAVRKAVSEQHELQVYGVLLLKVGSIPKTSSGKIQRNECKQRFLNGTLELVASSILEGFSGSEDESLLNREKLLDIPPEDRQPLMEAYLKNLLAKVLDVDPEWLDPQQPLGFIGIDSLKAVEVRNRLEATLGMLWPITRLLQGPTIIELAAEAVQKLLASPSASESRLAALHGQNESPLSHNQQSLWFMYQLAPESAAYNISFALRICSELDIPALKRSFESLVSRQASFRTIYTIRDNQTVQQIQDSPGPFFEAADASGWHHDEFRAALVKEFHLPFDLEKGPVIRVKLFTRSETEHTLLVTVHHIAADFWSMLSLLDELLMLYDAEISGRPNPLAPLNFSYTDYVRWQRNMLSGPEAERHWAYWRQKLSGDLPVLNLPTDHPRPPVQTYNGASCGFRLDPELTRKIKTLAQKEGATLYMTLLAAFQVLLYRYTGQDDIIVGSPTSGRVRTEFEEVMGYFVNPLAMRADLSGSPSFREFIKQVRQTVLEALDHQDYPFQLLVERLRPQREASRSPVIQVMFVLQQPHRLKESAGFVVREDGARMRAAGLDLESMSLESRVAQFDLTLMMVEADRGMAASLEYNTDLFESDTARRVVGHFRTLLEGIAENPDQPVSDLPMLTASERRQLLADFNDTEADFPRDRTIADLFEKQAEKTPDNIAVVFECTQVTYRELNQKANRIAHFLKDTYQIEPDAPAGVIMECSELMIAGIIGILKAGGAYIPIDPQYPEERIRYILRDSRCRVAITENKELSSGLSDCGVPLVNIRSVQHSSDENPPHSACSHDLAYIIYTSGSTGLPKGVQIEQRALLNLISWHTDVFHVQESSRATMYASVGFDASVWEMWPYLLNGACLFPLKAALKLDMDGLFNFFRDHNITHAFVPSPVCETLSALPQEGLEKLTLLTGGDVLKNIRPCKMKIINNYGPTEYTVVATSTAEPVLSPPIPIGRPICNTQIFILDQFLQMVPLGVPGEICISGAGLARGYLNKPELTAEKFVSHPFREGECLYRTGDLGRWLPDGNIEFLGRSDDQVKVRGYRIELGEIENCLLSHHAVKDAAVIAKAFRGDYKELAAYIVTDRKTQHPTPNTQLLREHLGKTLPDYMIPSYFVLLENLPLNPNGKIDRNALPDPAFADMFQGDLYVAPRNKTEADVAEVWSAVLGRSGIGIDDNYFALGGDSIKAIQVGSRLLQMGWKLDLRDLFRYPTIARVCPRLTAAEQHREQETVSGEVPLSAVQSWFFEEVQTDPHHFNQAVLLRACPRFEENPLRAALSAVWENHDALRLLYIPNKNGFVQQYADPAPAPAFEFLDLSTGENGPEAMEAHADRLQASMNLSEGPLMKCAMYRLKDADRLLIAIHHLVTDGVSWRILLEDLTAAYQHAAEGKPIQVPPKTASFGTWADMIYKYARQTDLSKESAYWRDITACQLPSLPWDMTPGDNLMRHAGTVSANLSVEETGILLTAAHHAYNTRAEDLLLTGLLLAFKNWTGQDRLLVLLEGHGREPLINADVSRTVGWFTSMYPVLLSLPPLSDDPGRVIKQVKETLRKVPNRGLGYGILRYIVRDESLSRGSRPDICFNYLGQFDEVAETNWFSLESMSPGQTVSPSHKRVHALDINAMVLNKQLNLFLTYDGTRFQVSAMQKLLEFYSAELRNLLKHCQKQTEQEKTPGDFSYSNLSIEAFGSILNELK